MKITVCQFYTENLPYGDFSEKINVRYCEKHGYDYYVEKNSQLIVDRLQGRSFTWYKPFLIKDVLEKYPNTDYVLFLDIDAIFSTEDRKIEEFIDGDFEIKMTSDYGPSEVNAGVMLLKNSDWVKDYLNKWWDICEEFPQYKTGLWHDQTCIGLLNERIDKTKFSIISPEDLNARDFDESKLVFHAFSYGMLPYRTIDSIYYHKFKITPPKGTNLVDLATMYGTDKHHFHNYYNRFYTRVLQPYKQKCDILEIGILGGKSLRVWEDYFESGVVHGIDINPVDMDNERIKTFLVDQSNEDSLREFSDKNYEYDVIIDDGSHKMLDQQITAQILFKNVKSGGLFIIEDLQTSLECRMPEKAIFQWGDPNRTTCLDMLESIQKNNPTSDYKTKEWDDFISQIESVQISLDRNDSIYSIIKKK
jgi:hypothetical protein